MKTQFLNKLMPVMIFLLGIAGAFGTMSMQKATENAAPITGWVHDVMGNPCAQPVACSDSDGPVCRVNYPSGQIAELKVGTVCVQPLFRPQ
ncbi:MAG TPA: DUF6520 family protein [Moheibacter sp.]|nr:DUF6520 family protein [Moheibacter sp.]